MQQEEQSDEGRQDEGTAEHGYNGGKLAGGNLDETWRLSATSTVFGSQWRPPLQRCCVPLLPPGQRGLALHLVLVQAGGEDQVTVRRTGQAVCGPSAGAGQAGRVAGQAGLDGGQVHPVLQGEVEELRPRGEAWRTQLHAALQEEREAGAALWTKGSHSGQSHLEPEA